jgi:hypothetical protein
MFSKRLQKGDQDGVAEDGDDEHTGGGLSPLEAIPVVFHPPKSFDDSLLSLCFFFFDLYASVPHERPGDPFYSRF